jgi:hypothetical protein
MPRPEETYEDDDDEEEGLEELDFSGRAYADDDSAYGEFAEEFETNDDTPRSDNF